MAETNKRSKKSNEGKVAESVSNHSLNNMEVAHDGKSGKVVNFISPKGVQMNKVASCGEFPLRTYEMIRNAFVGI